jgi:hypothetical protein
VELEDRIIVYEVEEHPGTEHEPENDLARPEVLRLAVNDASLNQGNDVVGNHLGMNAEIAMIFQVRQNGVRNCANAELETGSVRDQIGNMPPDCLLDFAAGMLA